jgi:hypothetical protein
MLPQIHLKSLFAIVALAAIGAWAWMQNPTRFAWTTVCEFHSFVPIPGYPEALVNYRTWLLENSFSECVPPSFGANELQYTDTKWFQSNEYPDIFVLTSGDEQNVIANVVVDVKDPMFIFLARATQSELKDYTEHVSGELHKLGHPMLDRQ